MRGQSHPFKGKHLDPHTEAEQEIREASVPGARGEEYHTKEREGDEGQPFKVFVDYAHTEDALRNVLGLLRQVSAGRIVTLFGCGGNRDKQKRPFMGKPAMASP